MTEDEKGAYAIRADRVADLMRDQGWTSQSLAAAADIDRSAFKRIFAGERLRMSTLSPIAKALKVSPKYLMKNGDESTKSPNESSKDRMGIVVRFSFELDVPYELLHEKEHVAPLLQKLGREMQQAGLLIIESYSPGSIRVVILATDPLDVARLFEAYARGAFTDIRMTNPHILADESTELAEVTSANDQHGVNPRQATPTTHHSDQLAQLTEHVDASQKQTPESSAQAAERPGEPSGSQQPQSVPPDLKIIMTGVATGAVIGSVIPGVGTAVGSIIGGAIAAFSARRGREHSSSKDDDSTHERPNTER